MSESEGVELTRASVDAFNRGDLEWLLERIDDDFVLDWSRSRGPLAGVYRGRAGSRSSCASSGRRSRRSTWRRWSTSTAGVSWWCRIA